MDSVEQIAALTRQWGGDPDRLYGRTLREQAQALTPGYSPGPLGMAQEAIVEHLRESHRLQKPNPYLHRELLEIVEEVADRLNVPIPTVYISPLGKASSSWMIPLTHEIAIADVALTLLNREELTALIGHEIQHFRQKDYRSVNKGVMVWGMGELAKWLQTHDVPGHSPVYNAIHRYIDQHAQKTTQYEYEADQVGSALTSKDAMLSMLVKTLAYDCGLDITQLSIEDALNAIDQLLDEQRIELTAVPEVPGKGYRFAERVERMKQADGMAPLSRE